MNQAFSQADDLNFFFLRLLSLHSGKGGDGKMTCSSRFPLLSFPYPKAAASAAAANTDYLQCQYAAPLPPPPALPSLLIRRLGILVRNLTTSQERPLINTRSSHCSASSCGEFVSSGLLWRGDASTTIMLRRVLSGASIVVLLLMLHVGLLCAALTSPFHGGNGWGRNREMPL